MYNVLNLLLFNYHLTHVYTYIFSTTDKWYVVLVILSELKRSRWFYFTEAHKHFFSDITTAKIENKILKKKKKIKDHYFGKNIWLPRLSCRERKYSYDTFVVRPTYCTWLMQQCHTLRNNNKKERKNIENPYTNSKFIIFMSST